MIFAKRFALLGLIISIAIFSIYRYSLGRSVFTKSTDLSNETIQGISLMEKYDRIATESKLGNIVETTRLTVGDYYSSVYYRQSEVTLMVNESALITKIYARVQSDGEIKTSKGINGYSTLKDIENAYGKNYLRKDTRIMMGNGAKEYAIKYIDKFNRSMLTFNFIKEVDKEQPFLVNLVLEKTQ